MDTLYACARCTAHKRRECSAALPCEYGQNEDIDSVFQQSAMDLNPWSESPRLASNTGYARRPMTAPVGRAGDAPVSTISVAVDTASSCAAAGRGAGTARRNSRAVARGAWFDELADTGTVRHEDVAAQGKAALGDDPHGYRSEFVQLVRQAQYARGM
jgi:hypothetical protein